MRTSPRRSSPTRALLLAFATALGVTGEVQAQQAPGGPQLVEDCNGNGIPDPLDIRSGTSLDCQGDGIPDECQLAEPIVYALDDGLFDGGVGTDQPHIAWLNHFVVQPGGEVLTGVDLQWGSVADGIAADLGIWSDPDGDGDPADAVLLASVPVVTEGGFSGAYRAVELDDVLVGSAGTGFFIGIWGTWPLAPDSYPAAFDTSDPDGASWWIASATRIQPDSLASGSITEYGLISQVCGCDGDWMIRPLSCATGHCREATDVDGDGIPDVCQDDCDGDGVPDSFQIGQDPTLDCNGNGTLDECEVFTDCDENLVPDECQAAGQGLVGQYYANRFLSGPFVGRIDPDVNFTFNGDELPDGIPNDDFSVRWTGSVFASTTGTYEFGVRHDDGARFYVNGVQLVDEWGPSAGAFDTNTIDLIGGRWYFLELEYYEGSGGALVELHWAPPGDVLDPMTPAELRPIYDRTGDGIPDSCQMIDCNGNGVSDADELATGSQADCNGDGILDSCQSCADRDRNGLLDVCEAALPNGLWGQYFRKGAFEGTFGDRLLNRVDPRIDFDWAGGSPAPGLPSDDFCVRWSGTLVAPSGGGGTAYQLHVRTDDGVRLWFDGQLLIDEYEADSGTEYTVGVTMAPGSQHLLQMDYFELGGQAIAELRWTPPGGAKEFLPNAVLRPTTDVNGDGLPDAYAEDCNANGVLDAFELDSDGDCVINDCELGTGYWRFEETTGSGIDDASGNGVQGFIVLPADRVGSVPVTVVPHTGQANQQSLDLFWTSTTSSGSAEVADPASLLAAGDESFTIQAWVQLDELSTNGPAERQWLIQRKPPLSADTLLDYGLLVQTGGGGGARNVAAWFGDGTSTQQVVSTFEITDSEWHHVSLSYDARRQSLRFGLDGSFEEIGYTKPAWAPVAPVIIGAHTNAQGARNQFLRGRIDELMFSRGYVPEDALLRSF